MDGVMERFERIYEEYRDAVRAYVRRRAPEALVDDLVSDVFVVGLRRIDDVSRNALPCCTAFPSAEQQVLTFPGRLQGIAADGVATVQFVDADGNVLDSTPVIDNLFASGTRIGMAVAAYVEALDANGVVLSKQKLAG